MKKTFIIRKDDIDRRGFAADFIHALDMNKNWRVTIVPLTKQRSLDQNAYIHSVPLKLISDHTGHSIDDMKEYLCGEFTGWREFMLGNREMRRPILTTSQMNTVQMFDFIEWLQWWGMDTLGIFIPPPEKQDDESTIPTDSR
jgi:hypothetical protein